MGRNIYEKILARASGKEDIKHGDIIWFTPDLIGLTDTGWHGHLKFFEQIGLEKVMKPEKIVGAIDHCPEQIAVPEGAENNKIFREWAKKNGVVNFYDIGRGGLLVQVLAERHVRPGMMVLPGDPEVQACGALGAFIASGDTALAMATDRCYIEVPEFVKCKVTGRFQGGVLSTDLKRKLLGDFGEEFGKFIEFVGPTIDKMSIDDRMNLCSLLYMSASLGIIAADQKTIDYVRSRTKEPFEAVRSDPDAIYAATFEYDVSKLEPQVSFPPSPNNVKAIAEAEGIEIHEANIGSCASGRLDDLRIAAQILKGRKVHPRVRMYITPVSQEVYLNAIREGLIAVFIEAGAGVCLPACGTCPGHTGQLAAGEVCIATTTGNNPGRIGSREAKIFLSSPAVVAASAVEGKIVDPRKYF